MEKQIAFMRESGLVSESPRTYVSGETRIGITLYTFRDSSGAYEAYTILQGAESPIKMFHETIPRSNLVLDIWSEANLGSDELKAAAAWVQSISDGVASPPVATYLPDLGRQPRSERYALGPAGCDIPSYKARADATALVDQIGFNSGAEAISARYKNGPNEATLLLIEYPTPQLAELHLKHMQRAILAAKNGDSVERKGSLLSIVLGPSSQEYAAKLRNSVNYETQVTWSEPSTTATDPPITSDCFRGRCLTARTRLRFCSWDCQANRSIRATCISAERSDTLASNGNVIVEGRAGEEQAPPLQKRGPRAAFAVF
jgi:hypothetical protein